MEATSASEATGGIGCCGHGRLPREWCATGPARPSARPGPREGGVSSGGNHSGPDPSSHARGAEAYALARRKYPLMPETGGRINSKVLGEFCPHPEWFRKPPLPRVATVMRGLSVRR
ncbi:MAG: hypothetical protein AVDCRST_MAG64-1263 [uncultured Phycisphaerae bacterium]|uniref:Uncharacterized protein n=1 Tax=uncultured Phycisphaerae bacterium TaxID=904963 RepID=A0A6J4NV76_9BACT|nr:MAG: hypothetical protein AVDCRST_MAG64-1263 [uncultured Phycisphaerae bacterium]